MSRQNSSKTKPTPSQTAAPEPRPQSAQAFYTIEQIAERWHCSESQVRRILAASGAKVLDMAEDGKAGKKIVPQKVLEKLERERTRKFS